MGARAGPRSGDDQAKLAPKLPERVCTDRDGERERGRETDSDRETETETETETEADRQAGGRAGDGSPPSPGLGGLPCSPSWKKLVKRGCWKRWLV